MPTPRRLPKRPPLLCALLLTVTLTNLYGCGGSSSSESLTHIQGSSASISKATLNHWMRAVLGGDFRQSVGTKGPVGLVSEPAKDSECVAAAKKLVPRSFTGQSKLSEAQLLQKCHELHEAVKAQAISYLLSAQTVALEAAEEGVVLSDAELHKEFARFRREAYPTEAELQQYMGERHLVLSDVLYAFKRNILSARITAKLQAKAKQSGSGGEAAFASLAVANYKGMIAKTTCKAGYVAQGCKGYREPARPAPAPNALLEAFVGGRNGAREVAQG